MLDQVEAEGERAEVTRFSRAVFLEVEGTIEEVPVTVERRTKPSEELAGAWRGDERQGRPLAKSPVLEAVAQRHQVHEVVGVQVGDDHRSQAFQRQALAEYERCFCRPEAIHAACEDYRASAGIDLAHDRESRARGDRLACDTLVLWGARGIIGKLFDPIALWQAQCSAKVEGRALPAGHFIPEELPGETAQALLAIRDYCLKSSDESLKPLGKLSLIPRFVTETR